LRVDEKDELRIEIRITELCNYNCSYCDSMNSMNSPDKFNFVDFKLMLDKLDKKLSFFVYGGEPTLNKEIYKIVELLYKYSDNVIIQTNGSQPSVINKLCLSHPNIKINYSFHREFVKYTELSKIINTNKKNLNEITVLQGTDIKIYKRLKLIYGDNTQFSSILNPKLFDTVEADNIFIKNILEYSNKYMEDIQYDDQFKILDNGLSKYKNWITGKISYGSDCNVEFNNLHIQDNKVYNCFNSMMSDYNGIQFKMYHHNPSVIQCPHQKCYFDISNQVGDLNE